MSSSRHRHNAQLCLVQRLLSLLQTHTQCIIVSPYTEILFLENFVCGQHQTATLKSKNKLSAPTARMSSVSTCFHWVLRVSANTFSISCAEYRLAWLHLTWHLATAFESLPVSHPTLCALADSLMKLCCQPEAQDALLLL